jgi:hypothetical protein
MWYGLGILFLSSDLQERSNLPLLVIAAPFFFRCAGDSATKNTGKLDARWESVFQSSTCGLLRDSAPADSDSFLETHHSVLGTEFTGSLEPKEGA